MKTSTQGLIALAGREGIVTSRYLDSVGVWTIGIGHTAHAGGLDPATHKGNITAKEAVDLFRKDIVKYENDVNAAVKVPITQAQFDALVSFHYNTGGIYRARLTELLNSSASIDAVADAFMGWSKPPEIIPRRKSEADQFRTGEYPPPVVTLYDATTSGKVLWGTGRQVDISGLLDGTNKPADSDPPPDASTQPETSRSPLAAFFIAIIKLFGGKNV